MVAASHGTDEEWAIGGGCVAVFDDVVEEGVVGYTPSADDLARGVAVLTYHVLEAVVEEESAHVVDILVVCHEVGSAVAGAGQGLWQAVDVRDSGLFHGVLAEDGGVGVEGGVDAVVGVNAG